MFAQEEIDNRGRDSQVVDDRVRVHPEEQLIVGRHKLRAYITGWILFVRVDLRRCSCTV